MKLVKMEVLIIGVKKDYALSFMNIFGKTLKQRFT
jgi:hypothetical protein